MPIKVNRDEDIGSQLARLSYGDGLDIREQAKRLLYAHPNHYYTADELSAKLDIAAAPVQIESVLSHHPDEFTYAKKDGRLYWQTTVEEL